MACLSLWLSACGPSRAAPPPPLPAAPGGASVAPDTASRALRGHAPELEELVGRTFILREARGAPELVGARVSLFFQTTDLGFSAGCNSHSGPYQLVAGALVAQQGFMATERGCPGSSLSAQEHAFARLLRQKLHVLLDGSTLTLH